jgi:alkylhydroperoxidase family enzyme
VVRDPNAATEADVEDLRRAGLDEKEIFEATAWIGLRLGFSTINDALGAQPDAELSMAAGSAVREAVSFGRPPASG